MAAIAWSAVAGATTITEPVASTTEKTLTVASVANLFPDKLTPGIGSIIFIDDEFMKITGIVSATVIQVERGYLGSTAATHSDNAPVHLVSLPELFKALKRATVLATAA